MGNGEDDYFRETTRLVAESQKTVADAWVVKNRALRATVEARKRLRSQRRLKSGSLYETFACAKRGAESLELIEAAKKVRKIKPAMLGK